MTGEGTARNDGLCGFSWVFCEILWGLAQGKGYVLALFRLFRLKRGKYSLYFLLYRTF
jgi:hypothetical protein